MFDANPMDSQARRHLVDRILNEPPLEVVALEGNYPPNQMVFDATCGAAVACLGNSNGTELIFA
jgi:hypothetical protein